MSRGRPGCRWLLRGGLAALLVAGATPALAIPQCTVASSAQLSFGTVVALASTGDVTTDSGTSFWINCNSEVGAAPQLHSAGLRAMQSGAQRLPFKLSLVSPAGSDLPASAPGAALNTLRNGTAQTVTLYAKIRASDFKALPGGVYAASISLTIDY